MALTFTAMGEMIDGAAVNACLTAGMIVVVELDKHARISGIVSANTSVIEAFASYQRCGTDPGFAVLFPSEQGSRMFYSFEGLELSDFEVYSKI